MRTITLVSCLLITTFSFSQNPFYDAISLANIIERNSGFLPIPTSLSDCVNNENDDPCLAASILEQYYGESQTDLGVIYSDYQNDNPFINSFINLVPSSVSVSDIKGGQAISAFNSLAGLDVTFIAKGASTFLIKRAKEELAITFFSRLQKKFEEYPELKALFPATSRVLVNMLSYHYSEVLPILQTSFQDDINEIPSHLKNVVGLEKYKELFKDLPEIRVTLKTVELINNLQKTAMHPSEVILRLSELDEWKNSSSNSQLQNFGNSIKLGAILSESIRNSDDGKGWVEASEIRSLLKNEVQFKLFLGLVYQQIKKNKIQFKDKSGKMLEVNDFMASTAQTIQTFKSYLNEFSILAQNIDRQMKTMKSSDIESKDIVYSYINSAINLLHYSTASVQQFDLGINIKEYLNAAQSANDLVKNIFNKNYRGALFNTVTIYQRFISLGELQANSITDGKKLLDSLKSSFVLVKKYGSFLANIAQAKTSEEVEAAIEAAVLPAGSSSIKKHSSFNISLQAHIGASRNWNTASNSSQTSWNEDFSITAPIGFSFNRGLSGNGGSLGLFVSLLDLGAIVDYELGLDSVVDANNMTTVSSTVDYKIELGQIISPGLFISYGFGYNIPLSLNVGVQYGPGIVRIEDTGTNQLIEPNWRGVASITVDIPLLTLRNKEKRKYKY